MERYTEVLYWADYDDYVHYDEKTGAYTFDPEFPIRARMSFGLWRKYGEMNSENTVRCSNNNCRYKVELSEGTGALGYFRLLNYLKSVESGETDNKEVKKCLEKNAVPFYGGIYVCETCKEFSRDDILYFEANGTTSPYGTYRCDYEFPLGLPKCEKCGSEKTFIPNIRSSKVKCPKCGSDLRVKSRKIRRY